MQPQTAHSLARSYALAIAAWAIIQIATVVFPLLNLPNWTVRWLLIVLLVGCPIAIATLWVFRPRGGRAATTTDSAIWVVIAAVFLVIASLVGYGFTQGGHAEPQALTIILLTLLLLCFPNVAAAIGMWCGRRWGWWVQLVLLCLNLLVFPLGTIVAGLAILFLLWIRKPYFEISSPQRKA